MPRHIYIQWGSRGSVNNQSSLAPGALNRPEEIGNIHVIFQTSDAFRFYKTHYNDQFLSIDLLILPHYTLFFGEEPQIPPNAQKVDTLVRSQVTAEAAWSLS